VRAALINAGGWTARRVKFVMDMHHKHTYLHTHTHIYRVSSEINAVRTDTRAIRTEVFFFSVIPPDCSIFWVCLKTAQNWHRRHPREWHFNSAFLCLWIALPFWNRVSLRWIVTLGNLEWGSQLVLGELNKVVLGTLPPPCVIWIWHTHTSIMLVSQSKLY
jgi:hypothetical protein